MKTDLFILLDTATEKQLYFQKPASQNMEMLIDLHNDIFLLLIPICTIIIAFLILILAFFKGDNFEIKQQTKQSRAFTLNDLLKKFLLLIFVIGTCAAIILFIYPVKLSPKMRDILIFYDSDALGLAIIVVPLVCIGISYIIWPPNNGKNNKDEKKKAEAEKKKKEEAELKRLKDELAKKKKDKLKEIVDKKYKEEQLRLAKKRFNEKILTFIASIGFFIALIWGPSGLIGNYTRKSDFDKKKFLFLLILVSISFYIVFYWLS